jgi:hypothetical protein
MKVPCPHCADGFNGPTRTKTAVCKSCGGTHQVEARTGETPEASYRPEVQPPTSDEMLEAAKQCRLRAAIPEELSKVTLLIAADMLERSASRIGR